MKNPFKNKVSDKDKESKNNSVVEHENKSDQVESSDSISFSGKGGHDTHKVLSGFYISEKASLGNSNNHYVFRVSKNANKSEVKKEVSKLFNVKVKEVKMISLPRKRRDFGRHPGFKSGIKKAVVVLEKGFSIGQAKP